MAYRALISFTGKVNMVKGEVRDLAEDLAKDLIKAGYIADLSEKQKVAKSSKAKTKGGESANG